MSKQTGKNSSSTLPETIVSQALVSSVYFFLIYLFYSFVLRTLNFVTLVRAGEADLTPLGPPFSLPFILGEEFVIGSIFAAILFVGWKRPILKIVTVVTISLYLVFLAFDQIAFKIFFSHIDYILYSDTHDLVRMSSSIMGSLDLAFAVHIALALACPVLLFVKYRPKFVLRLSSIVLKRPFFTALLGGTYLGVTITFVFATDQHTLNESFPVTYVRSYFESIAEERLLLTDVTTASNSFAAKSSHQSLEKKIDQSDKKKSVKTATAVTEEKLNVVWYLMESVSFRESSLYSKNNYDTTPFLKELADKSLFFPNYYTMVAASTRSFVSCLTGLYPYVDPSSDLIKYSAIKVPTLVDILHDTGYTTAFFSGSDTMFESLDTFLANRNYDVFVDKNLIPTKKRDGESMLSWGVDDEIMIDRALEWIESVKDSGAPFYVNFNAVYPHHPFNVPQRHRNLNEMDWGKEGLRSAYRASLYYADMSVKRFYQGLKRLNVADNTLFIVTPDHGEAFGDLHKKNLIHAEYCYDEDSHIFLILNNPRVFDRPVENKLLGSHTDILPTILSILNIEEELEIDGQNLLSDDYQQPFIFCYSRRQLGVRDGNLKFVTARKNREAELYDLESDPQEQKNIAKKHPDKVVAYEKSARGWMASVTRAYADLAEKSGLSKHEIQGAAASSRDKLFGGARAKIASAGICKTKNRAACATGSNRTFDQRQPLTVQVLVRKPGYVRIKVELFDPGGKKVFKKKSVLQHGKTKEIYRDLPADLFKMPGQYRARVFLLSSHTIHDSAAILFNIKE